MKQSKMLIPTLKEVPADAEIKSHQFLLRAGYIRQNASGIYSYLPLANKVLKKIEAIVREEMNEAGAVEMLMPALQQGELWQESGRWYTYGPELMRLKDRNNRDFALGATHEEVITSLMRDEVKSYKKLPLTVYQIQTKFRDEKRPRFGILRGREFIMKDAYSFHTNKESLDEVYQALFTAYSNIFRRCDLNFRAVIADSGAMGGKDTHEFMVLSEVGEDTIAYSDQSDYAANIEMAPVNVTYKRTEEALLERKKVETINKKSIAEVTDFLQVPAAKCIKTLLFKVDDRPVLVLCRGDHEVNDIKLKNYYGAETVALADAEDTKALLHCPVGSLGPVGVTDIEIIADSAVSGIVNGVCGANEENYHYINVNIGRDFSAVQVADLRFIEEGDPSPDGQGVIKFAKGIEVGHVFKLGTRYSDAMHATYLDENGREQPMIMGCYGIGITRTMAAIAEQCNDEKGLIWPLSVSPFAVHLIPINLNDDDQASLSATIYAELRKRHIEVLMDDRKERPGVKFAESDLIGLPLRITVGKKAGEGIVELKVRRTGEMLEVHQADLYNTVSSLLSKL
ncbi:proline--tRNA ligase [Bacillaceae bacterium Marseille-Q3522]|nr:proline--tRNA ligase [Bacillaceae bacterium Marseille-Q3522]